MISNLVVGWAGMLGGVLTGAAIGLFFEREEWMGGYASFPRRLARLGHIAFFGLGFLNILFGLKIGAKKQIITDTVEMSPMTSRCLDDDSTVTIQLQHLSNAS